MSLSSPFLQRRRLRLAVDAATSVADQPALDDPLLDDGVLDGSCVDDGVLDGSCVDDGVLDGSIVDGSIVDGSGEPDVGIRSAERLDFVERCAWTVVWLGVLVNACDLWGSWWSWPVVDALAPALVAVALAGFALCWRAGHPRVWWHQASAMAAALVSTVTQQVIGIHTRVYYQTDSAALDHVAARDLSEGRNPYTSSLAGAARLLKPAADYWTYTVSGDHVLNLSYPAGSILVYAPAFLLGFRHEVVDWVDLYFWVASAVLLFFLVPRSLRWLSALVALSGFFVAFFSNGGTDAAFIPFAMLAVWRWDRYGRGKDAGVASWIGPVALGLACSVKQVPWFCVPFLVVGLSIEARRSGRSPLRLVGRYLAVALAVFTAVNAPFIVWSASAWWQGTITPFARPLVADGQGLVSLALHGLTGGVDLRLLTAASGLALLCALAAFAAWYRQLKRIWLLLLPIVFFFSTRSLSSYLLDLFPVALVALITTRTPETATERVPANLEHAPHRTRSAHAREPARLGGWGELRRPGTRRWARLVTTVLAAATCATAALAFTRAPLDLTYRSAAISSQKTLRSVTVTITNRTAGTVVPHFMVDVGAAHPTGFWTTAGRRPVVVGPYRTRTVTLFPPSTTFLPLQGSDYVVQAYTADPDALSTTNDIWRNYSPAQVPD